MQHIASDLEGTLVTYETYMGLRDHLRATGRGGEWNRFFYTFIPRYLLAKVGLGNIQDMRARYFDGMTKFLQGYTRAQVDAWATGVADRMWDTRRKAVVAELQAHAEAGARVVIASGSYPEVIRKIAARIHPTVEVIGTKIAWGADERVTGRIDGPVSYGETKTERVKAWCNGARLSMAYGDSDADIGMLALAETAVAVCPADKVLARAAAQRGWRVIDLKASGT